MTQFGVARRWRDAVAQRVGPSLLIFLAMGSLFIGSSESSSSVSLAADTTRVTRAVVLCIIFFVSTLGVLFHPYSISLAGKAAHWMILYAFLAMMSSVYSVSPVVSLWKGFEVLTFVVMGIYLSRYFRVLEDIQWSLDIISFTMLYFSVSVVFSVALLPTLALPKSQSMAGAEIVSGAHSLIPPIYPNSVTQFAAFLFCLTLCQFLSSQFTKGKTGLLAILSLGAIVMVLGHSRTSIFAALVASGLVLVMGQYIVTALLVGLMSGAGILYGIGDILASYMLRGQTEQAFYGMTGRVYFWKGMINVILDSPFVGHGFYAQRIMLSVSSVDNTYLQVLLGLGVVGLIAIVIPLLIIAYQLWTTRPDNRASSQERVIWLQLVSVYTIIIVRSMTGPTFQDFNINLVLLMLIILAVTAFTEIRRSGRNLSC